MIPRRRKKSKVCNKRILSCIVLSIIFITPIWMMYHTITMPSLREEVKTPRAESIAYATCDARLKSRHLVLLGLPQSGVSILNDAFSNSAKLSKNPHPVDKTLSIDTSIGKINDLVLPLLPEDIDSWNVRNRYETSRHTKRKIPKWIQHGVDENNIDPSRINVFRTRAEEFVREHRVLMADPRTSLLSESWRSILGNSHVCIHVLQSPLEFGESMQRFSHLGRVSLSEWSRIWEVYVRRSSILCGDRPTVYVSSAELVQNPVSTIQKIRSEMSDVFEFDEFSESNVRRSHHHFVMFSSSLWKNELKAQDVYSSSNTKSSEDTSRAMYVYDSLMSSRNRCVLVAKLDKVSWKPFDHVRHEAYATIVTGDASTYVSGAVVNGIAISSKDSSRDMVALVTHHVSEPSRRLLRYFGWRVWEVEDLNEPWFGDGHSNRCKKFSPDQKVRWGRMATKLRLWQLVSYQSVLYMDCDAMAVGSVFDIFDLYRDHTIVGEGSVRKKDIFLAGVMFLKPDAKMFEKFMDRYNSPPPKIWGGSVDCTEQALINDIFMDIPSSEKRFSIVKTESKSIGRPTMKRDWTKHVPWIVHYLTKACEKPWSRFVKGTQASSRSIRRRHKCDKVPEALWERTATVAGLVTGMHPFTDLPKSVAFEHSEEEDILINIQMGRKNK